MEAPLGYIHTDKTGKKFRRIAETGGPGDWVELNSNPSTVKEFTPEPPNALERLGRGVADVTQGAEQIYRRVFDPESAPAFEAQANRDLATYNQGADLGLVHPVTKERSMDLFRLGGNVGALSPLALLPGGQGLAARTALGAAAGGTSGGLLYTPTDEGGNFGMDKAIQTGTGAVAGGAVGAVAPYLLKSISALSGKAQKLWHKFSPNVKNKIIESLSSEVKATGGNWAGLSDDIRAGMIDDAISQMDEVGSFNAKAVARKHNIERFYDTPDTAPTTGQITRDPKAWQQERNLSKLEDVGDNLRYRYAAQNQKGHQVVEDYAERFGIELDPADVGVDFKSTAREISRKSQKTVSEAYRKAAENVDVNDMVAAPKTLSHQLQKSLDDFEDLLPGNVKRRVTEFIDQERPMSVKEVEKAMRLVNRQKAIRGNREDVTSALDAIHGNLTYGLDATARMGGKAAEGLRGAAALAAKRFGLIRGSGRNKVKLIERVIEGGRVDNLVRSKVMVGNPDDLVQVKRFLLEFDEGVFPGIPKADAARAWNQIRAATLREINKKGGYSHDPSTGLLSGIKLQKAWRALGERRQKILFNNEERAYIESMFQAITDMTFEPPFSAVNSSNTAAGLANLARRVIRVPGMGPLVEVLSAAGTQTANAAAKVSTKNKVSGALAGRLSTDGERLARQEYLRRLLGSGPAVIAGQAVNQ